MVADEIERRWLTALVSLRQYASLRSEAWRRTAASIDHSRQALVRFDDTDALAREYIAVVLGRRIRIDDPATQPSQFVRDASFALRYVELRTGLVLSAAALPSWLGEWAVAET